MITIKILKSHDENRIGEYKFFKNKISIGHKLDNDLYIKDVSIPDIKFRLECTVNSLVISPLKNSFHYHLNGKLTTTYKKLLKNDIVRYKDTEFIVVDFEFEDLKSNTQLLNQNLVNIEATDPDLYKLIELIN